MVSMAFSHSATQPLSPKHSALLLLFSLSLSTLSPSAAISYDGELPLFDTAGGLFGAVTDGTDGWFGVDGYPAKIVRVRLGVSSFVERKAEFEGGDESGKDGLEDMLEVSRLELKAEEERLWSLIAEPRDPNSDSWYAYVGVGNPPGRLVKVDLLAMKRVGYVQLSNKDVRGGIVKGDYAYFATSSKPASILRCPTKEMFHGDTFNPMEVQLALGEHNVQAVLMDQTQQHLVLGTYTQPARVVKLGIPSMTRSASLLLPAGDDMIYSGANWGKYAIFGTSTLPGRVVKVDLEAMTHLQTLTLESGEDRAVSLVVFEGKAFVGLANEWEEDTSSIVQVDLNTMREESALVTPKGCTWLYAVVEAKGFAFFGSRYHSVSKIGRIGLRVAKPDVPLTPTGNATGQDAVRLSWSRGFPRYHNGGAEVLGARVLVRPAWHWDWTSEHVFGQAAPDPYAPTTGLGAILRVHEDPFELLDGGYGAIVDELDPMESYKFAVILTNSAGASHRSRSSEPITTSFSARLELLLLGMGTLLDVLIMLAWITAAKKAEEEEDQPIRYDTSPEGSGLLGSDIDSGAGNTWGVSVKSFMHQFTSEGVALTEPALVLGLTITFLVVSFPFQIIFQKYVRNPKQQSDENSTLISGLFIVSLVLISWSMSGIYWSYRKELSARARSWAVAAAGALWAAVSSALATFMAWSGSSPSPKAGSIAITVTWQLLLIFSFGAVAEAYFSYRIMSRARRGGEPAGPPAPSIPDWVMAL